jgi:SAM-dependent methyltransferase
MVEQMEYTGERMMPQDADEQTFWEHIYRYRFAARIAAGQRVLDIACGEGYGTAALRSAGARSVLGVDVDPAACDHASRTYAVETRLGSALSIPVEMKSIDLVVSFETIEHINDHERFLDECKRVLVPGGSLVISTPDAEHYSSYYKFTNVFHTHELTRSQFVGVLRQKFRDVQIFHQMPTRYVPRGVGRLVRLMGMLAGTGQSGTEAARHFRSDPVAAITGAKDPLGAFANPFRVVRPAWWRGLSPLYLVAIATAPKSS